MLPIITSLEDALDLLSEALMSRLLLTSRGGGGGHHLLVMVRRGLGDRSRDDGCRLDRGCLDQLGPLDRYPFLNNACGLHMLLVDDWSDWLVMHDRLQVLLDEARTLALLVNQIAVLLVDDGLVQLVDDFLELLMDDRLVKFTHLFLVDYRLMMLMNQRLMMLVHNILVVFMEHVFVVLVDHVSVRLLDDWHILVQLLAARDLMALVDRLFHVLFDH